MKPKTTHSLGAARLLAKDIEDNARAIAKLEKQALKLREQASEMLRQTLKDTKTKIKAGAVASEIPYTRFLNIVYGNQFIYPVELVGIFQALTKPQH